MVLYKKDGKKYLTDVADLEQILRIVQSIPSKKAEPLKRWLAQVGSERNLAYARKAYVLYPDYNILQTRLQNLSWSHLCLLTGVEEDAAREWYFQAAQDDRCGIKTCKKFAFS